MLSQWEYAGVDLPKVTGNTQKLQSSLAKFSAAVARARVVLSAPFGSVVFKERESALAAIHPLSRECLQAPGRSETIRALNSAVCDAFFAGVSGTALQRGLKHVVPVFQAAAQLARNSTQNKVSTEEEECISQLAVLAYHVLLVQTKYGIELPDALEQRKALVGMKDACDMLLAHGGRSRQPERFLEGLCVLELCGHATSGLLSRWYQRMQVQKDAKAAVWPAILQPALALRPAEGRLSAIKASMLADLSHWRIVLLMYAAIVKVRLPVELTLAPAPSAASSAGGAAAAADDEEMSDVEGHSAASSHPPVSQRLRRATAAAANAALRQEPARKHNLPPSISEQTASSASASAAQHAHAQFYHPVAQWENGLHANAALLRLEVKKSGVRMRGAGCGVFAMRAIQQGEIIAYLCGKFVAQEEWESIQTHGKELPCRWRDGEEEYAAPARRGSYRCVAVPMQSDGASLLLASEQCPAAYINQGEEADINVEIQFPQHAFSEDDQPAYQYLPVCARQGIAEGQELLTSYGYKLTAPQPAQSARRSGRHTLTESSPQLSRKGSASSSSAAPAAAAAASARPLICSNLRLHSYGDRLPNIDAMLSQSSLPNLVVASASSSTSAALHVSGSTKIAHGAAQ